MADNLPLQTDATKQIATDEVGGVHFPRTKITIGADGVDGGVVSPSNPLPVYLDAATIAALESISVTGPLTDDELRATPVPVSGAFFQATQPISAASLPLPAGAATETSLSALLASYKAEDTPHTSGDLGLPLLGIRYVADTVTTSNDGDYANFKLDEEGRLKVATKSASFTPVSGNAMVVGNTVYCDVSRASNVSFHVKNTGSVPLAAGTFVYEASVDSTNGVDGTWFGVQVARSNANTTETQTALSGIAAGSGFTTAFECSVNAYAWFRVRCTVAVTTNAIATWTIQRGTYATEPVPIVQVTGTQPISGTVTATVTPPAPTTPYFVNSIASTNSALIITGTSGLQAFWATNTGATAAYVKLYNKATAPIVGTDVPEMIIPVPAAASGVPGIASVSIGFSGFRFALGLGIAITGGVADSDTTAVAAGQVKVKLSRTV